MHRIKKFPIGGIHLPERKALTTELPVTVVVPDCTIEIPLRQHLGVPCRAVVAAGDEVRIGQLIGMNDQGLSARVHSSASGRVREITTREMVDGSKVSVVVIEPAQTADWKTQIGAWLNGDAASSQEDVPPPDVVIQRVEEAGIIGMGGAGFPTHLKLGGKHGHAIDTVIINGAECEPFITTDDRLMQEHAATVFRGLEIIRRTVGAAKGYVACEINKPAAIAALQQEAAHWPHLEAVRLDTRYPHGAEKHLIKAVLNREVPTRQLPMAVGVVVNNVQTAVAIAAAVDREQPLIARVLTVSGPAIRNPGNFLVPIGTPIHCLIEAAGGMSSEDAIVIVGGPMTGVATKDLDQPITKNTSGIVVMPSSEYADRSCDPCIRCGRCVEVCPMYLQPNRITAAVNNEMFDVAQDLGVEDCILCGACSFVCPSRRPLLQWLRTGKAHVAQHATTR